MASIEEIDNRIAELHQQGKGTRIISANVHKNFSYVGARLRILFPEEYTDSKLSSEPQVSKETQALKAFHAGRSPTEAAIEFGLTTDDTEKFYKNYWRLERLYELYRIYDENKPILQLFLYFLKELRKRNATSRKQFDEVLKIIDTNNSFDEELEDLNTNFLPATLNPRHPSRLIDKQIIRQDDETSVPVNGFYTLDEVERAFYET